MIQQKVIKPQQGYQTAALSSAADIVIGGGAAGAGKTFGLLIEPLRHQHVDNFGAVIFRRTYPMIRAEGGLWDASQKIYGSIREAVARESFMEWTIGKAKLKFAHLQHEKNIYDWQGSEIPLIEFDELTHFSKKMFFYLLTRNRSTCGIRPYVRATCNPDPDSWVAELIAWWIDQDEKFPNGEENPNYGFPIQERQGVIRYFMVDNDNYIWGNAPEEVIEKGWHVLEAMVERSGIDPREFIKSITFIGGSIYDNAELLKINPGYLANLNSQPDEIKSQLLDGNWKIKKTDRDIYPHHLFADIFTNSHVKPGTKCVTADIALEGSDLLFAFAWDGKIIVDFLAYQKNDGPEAVKGIKGLAEKWSIPNSKIVFDGDGLGQFLKGFLKGSIEFLNGSSALPDPNNPTIVTDPKTGKPKIVPENYANLKTQCYYRSGQSVERAEYYVMPEVAEREVIPGSGITLQMAMMKERRAIKKGKNANDGKRTIITKDEMKTFLNGKSPDIMDAFMMRELIDLAPAGRKPKARF